MTKQTSEHCHCANPGCAGLPFSLPLTKRNWQPRSVCGRPLQKSQLQPVFSCLDFLRGEDLPETEDHRDAD